MEKISFGKILKSAAIFMICFLALNMNFVCKAADISCGASSIDLVFYISTDETMNNNDSLTHDEEFKSACDEILGPEELLGPDGIVGRLQAQGYTVNYKIYGIGKMMPDGHKHNLCASDIIADGANKDGSNWGTVTSWVAQNYDDIASQNGWPTSAKKIAVPIGDNCPSVWADDSICGSGDQNAINQAIAAAKNKNVIVAPIIINGNSQPYGLAESLASGTGGVALNNSAASAFVSSVDKVLPSLSTNPCPDQCIDNTIKNGVCQSGHCVYTAAGAKCDEPGPCQAPEGQCTIEGGKGTCKYAASNASCNKPGFCQMGTGECTVVSGKETCKYPVDSKGCDLDKNACTYDYCKASTDGTSATCQPGQNICGGIIPCGRLADDPSTKNDETKSCTFCHLAMVANNSIDYLFQIVSTVALLALILAGFLFIISGGNPGRRSLAKGYLVNIIKGYAIMFLSWLIVDFILSAWGFINPIKGNWNVVCSMLDIFKIL